MFEMIFPQKQNYLGRSPPNASASYAYAVTKL